MRLVLAACVLFAVPALADAPRILPGPAAIKKKGAAIQRAEAHGLTDQNGQPVEKAAPTPETKGDAPGPLTGSGKPAAAPVSPKRGEANGLIIQNGKDAPAAKVAAPRPAAKR